MKNQSPFPFRIFLSVAALAVLSQPQHLPAQVVDRTTHGLGPASAGAPIFAPPGTLFVAGDFNGDGLDDIAAAERTAAGTVRVYFNTGSGFSGGVIDGNAQVFASEIPLTGDFNGDGRDDLAAFSRDTMGDVWVNLARSDNTFGFTTQWHDYFALGDEIPLTGDFDGDGRDDIATCTRGSSADVYVAISTGYSFEGTGVLWHPDFCPGTAIPATGDVDADGKDDLIAFIRSSLAGTAEGDVFVARSTGAKFLFQEKWHDYFCIGDEPPLVGDLTGDGSADLLTFAPDFQVYGATSSRAYFEGIGWRWHPGLNLGFQSPSSCQYLAGHFNGDLNTDVIRLEAFGFGTTIYTAVQSLCGALAQPETRSVPNMESDFGLGTLAVNPGGAFIHPPMASRPATETIPLLVLLLAAPAEPSIGRTAFAFSQSYYDSMVFGPSHPNLNAWFREMSGNKFAFSRAGVVGPVSVSAAGGNPAFAAALSQIDLRAAGLDPNGNGIIENNEMAVLVFDNYSEDFAANRPFDVVATQPNGQPNIRVRLDFGLAGHRSAIQNPAHELVHCLGVYWDTYNTNCFGQGYTLMGCTAGPNPNQLWHLDPWHKLRLGWLNPRVADISKFPGMAVIDPPQRAPLAGYRPPVLIHDPRRGTHEFFMLDYRDRNFTGGTPTGSGQSGYDRDVANTGVKPWYVRTETNHNVYQLPNAIILPGMDNVRNTTIDPSTDDVYDPGLTVVWPGRNGVVDTTPDFRDQLWFNICHFPTFTPWDYGTRDSGQLLDGVSMRIISPDWLDGQSLGIQVAMERDATRQTAIVQWGDEFTPWIAENPGPLYASSVHYLTGQLGVRTAEAGMPRGELASLSPSGSARYSTLDSWNGTSAQFTVPHRLPSGDYRFRVSYPDTMSWLSSNSWKVRVNNPYHDWLATHYPADRITAWDEVRPDRDDDGDGYSNALEFESGTNPRNPASAPASLAGSLHPDGFHLEWNGRYSQPGLYEIIPEWSTNLITWHLATDLRGFSFPDGTTHWTAVAPLPPGSSRIFMRLRTRDLSGM